MSKYNYDASRFPPGTKVKIRGERDFHVGQEGEVIRADSRNSFWVRIGSDIYRKHGRTLVLIQLGPPIPKVNESRENLPEDFRKAYKKMQEKDPRFIKSVRPFVW